MGIFSDFILDTSACDVVETYLLDPDCCHGLRLSGVQEVSMVSGQAPEGLGCKERNVE